MITTPKIYRSTSTNVFFNQGVELDLFEKVLDGEYILYLWINDGAVVIGRNQRADLEVDVELLEKDGKVLARRLSGGGAVYHDSGNVNFTFIAKSKAFDLDRNRKVILETLKGLGLAPVLTGRNDIEIDGAKVSGNAYYKRDGNEFHHGTMLVSSSQKDVGKYLTPNTVKFEGKAVKSVSSRVKSLADFDKNVTTERFIAEITKQFQVEFGGAVAEVVNIDVSDKVQFFKDKEWRYGKSKPSNHKVSLSVDCNRLEIELNLKDDVITDCHVYTDSLDQDIVDKISSEILNKNLKEDSGYILDRIKEEIYDL